MQNKSLCTELITLLTGNELDDTVNVNNQKPIKVTSDSKGVRYDVYVEDKHSSYDAEMQNDDSKKNLPKRSRYYQGMMDLNLLESGAHYNALKSSYVIFICTYDPFNEKLCCYEFQNLCLDKHDILFNDGRKILIFNTKGTNVNVTREVKEFLEYIETGKVTNEFLKKLNLEVKKVRQNKEWRLEYMKTWIRDMELREEGIEKGAIKGQTDERARIVTQKIKKGMTLEEIAESIELDPDDIRELYNQIVAEVSNYSI